jgi:hypothetical protein
MYASFKWEDFGFSEKITAGTEINMHDVAFANSRMSKWFLVVSWCFLHNNFTPSTVASKEVVSLVIMGKDMRK